MKRILTVLVICLLTFSITPVISQELENLHLDVRDYNGIELPAGTFVSVESAQEISTQYCQNGYKAYFITTNDYYIGDTNVIPESTTFVGYVEDVHDPIVGTNASFKVKITKMVLPDGFEMKVNGYIYSDNKNIIGGEMTAPAEWRKMPHYQSMLRYSQISLQVRPARLRQKGVHTVITSGEDRIIVLTEPVMITHTLTN